MTSMPTIIPHGLVSDQYRFDRSLGRGGPYNPTRPTPIYPVGYGNNGGGGGIYPMQFQGSDAHGTSPQAVARATYKNQHGGEDDPRYAPQPIIPYQDPRVQVAQIQADGQRSIAESNAASRERLAAMKPAPVAKMPPDVLAQYHARGLALSQTLRAAIENQQAIQKEFDAEPQDKSGHDTPQKSVLRQRLNEAYANNNDAQKAYDAFSQTLPSAAPAQPSAPNQPATQSPPATQPAAQPMAQPANIVPQNDGSPTRQPTAIIPMRTAIGPTASGAPQGGGSQSLPPAIIPSISDLAHIQNQAASRADHNLTPNERARVEAHFGGDRDAIRAYYHSEGEEAGTANDKLTNPVINGQKITPNMFDQMGADANKKFAAQDAAKIIPYSQSNIDQGHAYNNYVNRNGLNSIVNQGSASVWPENNGAGNPANYTSLPTGGSYFSPNGIAPTTAATMRGAAADNSQDRRINPVLASNDASETANSQLAQSQAQMPAIQQNLARTTAALPAPRAPQPAPKIAAPAPQAAPATSAVPAAPSVLAPPNPDGTHPAFPGIKFGTQSDGPKGWGWYGQ